METIIVCKKTFELSGPECGRCLLLTFGPKKGAMYKAIEKAYNSKDPTCKSLLLKQDGEIVAHAFYSSNTALTYFYVNPKKRRQGLGSRLIAEVKKDLGRNPIVFPHDKRSGKFFATQVALIELNRKENRKWLYPIKHIEPGSEIKLFFVDNQGQKTPLMPDHQLFFVRQGTKQLFVKDADGNPCSFYLWHYHSGKQKTLCQPVKQTFEQTKESV